MPYVKWIASKNTFTFSFTLSFSFQWFLVFISLITHSTITQLQYGSRGMDLGRSSSGATNLALGDNTQLSLVSRVVASKLLERVWDNIIGFPVDGSKSKTWAIGQHQNQSNLSAGSRFTGKRHPFRTPVSR